MDNKVDKEFQMIMDFLSRGKIENKDYEELINQLKCLKGRYDELNECINTKPVDRFNKGYIQRDLNKCFEAMKEMMIFEDSNFKSSFLIRNCLKSPLHYEYSDEEFEFNKKLFLRGYSILTKNDECKKNRDTLLEFYVVIEALHKNYTK